MHIICLLSSQSRAPETELSSSNGSHQLSASVPETFIRGSLLKALFATRVSTVYSLLNP